MKAMQHKMELKVDFESYLREMNDIYYWKFLLQPILTTGCVSLALFSQFSTTYLYKYMSSPEFPISLFLYLYGSWTNGLALCIYFQLLVSWYMGNGVMKSVKWQKINIINGKSIKPCWTFSVSKLMGVCCFLTIWLNANMLKNIVHLRSASDILQRLAKASVHTCSNLRRKCPCIADWHQV